LFYGLSVGRENIPHFPALCNFRAARSWMATARVTLRESFAAVKSRTEQNGI